MLYLFYFCVGKFTIKAFIIPVMSAKPVKKILVIRFRRVGDAVISSVLCSSLKKSFPQAEIHYVLNEAIASLFENHPHIDKLIRFSEADQKPFLTYVGKVAEIMREGNYDIVLDTRSTLKTLWFSLFSLSSPWRIGRLKSYNRWFQNYRVPLGYDDEVSNTLKLLNPLKAKYPIAEVRDFCLHVSEEERSAFSKKMVAQGMDLDKPVVACAVTARLDEKIWAREKMVDTLSRVLGEYPTVQLVFNYAGEREKRNAEKIFEDLGKNPRIFINLEASNLRELLALFSFSSFFFGNEGGPRHISQAMNVPSFAIFSPSISKSVWLPNASPRFQGVEVGDIDPALVANDSLTFEEKFGAIDPQFVWTKLDAMLKVYL